VFDFRYHALSLVAVFVALAVGLLLGVAIGDAGLVSSGEQKLREDLRGDVSKARAQERDAEEAVQAHEDFENAAYPALVGHRLEGRPRIALIGLGGLSSSDSSDVRAALAGTGADVTSQAIVSEPLDITALAKRSVGTRYAGLVNDPALAEQFGYRLGTQWLQGGDLLNRVRKTLLSSFSGEFKGHEGVVLVRDDVKLPKDKDQKAATEAFEKGLIKGLSRYGVPVVGIESTSTDPSHVSWYRDRGISSVDNIDQLSGKTALVFLLAGAQQGHRAYGVKSSRDDLLPPFEP
jgi:hypothetical protein